MILDYLSHMETLTTTHALSVGSHVFVVLIFKYKRIIGLTQRAFLFYTHRSVANHVDNTMEYISTFDAWLPFASSSTHCS